MKITEMIKQLGGNRAAIAEQAGMSIHQLNNLVSQDREVAQLKGGSFILLSKKTIRFDKPKTNSY